MNNVKTLPKEMRDLYHAAKPLIAYLEKQFGSAPVSVIVTADDVVLMEHYMKVQRTVDEDSVDNYVT